MFVGADDFALLGGQALPPCAVVVGAALGLGLGFGQQALALGVFGLAGKGAGLFGFDAVAGVFDAFGFVFVVDAGEAEGEASGLYHGFVAQHAAGVGFPRLGVAAAFVHVFGYDDGMAAVFAVDAAGAAFSVLLEVHAVEVGVAVDDARPAVHADNGGDAAVAGESVNLAGKGVQVVLGGDNQ